MAERGLALVTGASSGIGRATALALAEAGWSVLGTGRDRAALAGLPSPIRSMAGDLTDPGFVDAVVAAAGAATLLVNNAGTLAHAPFLETPRHGWRAVFDLNVHALLDLTQGIARGMAARGAGHVVLVSSLLARRVGPNTLVYAASKHAVAAIAAGLRAELRPHGIRVTEVAPGLVSTRIQREITHAGVKAGYAALPFDWLAPEDVAAVIRAAAEAPPNAATDLIEIRPQGQA
jgi:NADP-dependent 3-hydroxy acid dehydrogenase YdfG